MVQLIWLRVRRFSQERRGNVAVIFAIMLVPIVLFVGVAADYGRATAARSQMQMALDATALMVAKSASTMTAAQLNTQSQTYFTAQYARKDVSNVSVNANYSKTGGNQTLTLTVGGSLATTVTQIAGVQTLPISSSTTVQLGGGPRLRVSLVLDNTGSMAQSGKMTALQTASKNLLTQLQQAVVNTGDVYVSIIPFTTDINVGSSNVNATWIDWSQWSSGGYGGDGGDDGCPWWYSNCNSTSSHSNWNGCVMDRGNANGPSSLNYDTNVVAPTTTDTGSLFPADSSGTCPVAMMPLGTNWTGMTSLINSMQPNGSTNQAIGLAHGWMSLVGGGPYPTPPAMDPNYQYKQVIILLTDGLNTADRWYSNQSQIDARQAITCANIKAAGITLYTIQVDTDNSGQSSILQSCATTASNYYLLKNSSQIIDIFNQIGSTLTQLYISG
jgi:Flp pilus assembly protein TadG